MKAIGGRRNASAKKPRLDLGREGGGKGKSSRGFKCIALAWGKRPPEGIGKRGRREGGIPSGGQNPKKKNLRQGREERRREEGGE